MTSDNKNSHEKEIDHVSGVETTGHDWDGIKELNHPTPRWWLIVWLVTAIWAVGYAVVYPTWPTLSGEGERGGTEGTLGWTQYKQLKESQAEIMARKQAYLEKFSVASFEQIATDPALSTFAIAGGKAAFKDNCATCHGTGGAGAKGYPNLNDDDWIWGGSTEEIYQTLKYGIRADHDDTRVSEMPAFADVLEKQEIVAVASFVKSLAKGGAVSDQGAEIFAENCAACHGDDAKGLREMGAPNLIDAIWLYADSEGDVISQISAPKHGIMPAWEARLSDDTLRQLAIYVHSLGGGE